MLSVILVEPEHPGNIGAIARAMANFELKHLILFKPQCSIRSAEARNRAKNAQHILKTTAVIKKGTLKTLLKKYDSCIATTAQLGTDYNLLRSPLTPEQLAQKIKGCMHNNHVNIALLFGREGIGLRNKELSLADFVVHIPVSKAYAALNVSQAATIIFYELFKHTAVRHTSSHITPISSKDKEIVLWRIQQVLDQLTFTRPEKKHTQELVWKKVINKAFLSKREAFALLGFFRKLIRE